MAAGESAPNQAAVEPVEAEESLRPASRERLRVVVAPIHPK